MAAAVEAMADSGLEGFDPDRAAVIMGTGIGGMGTLVAQQQVLEERGAKRVSLGTVPDFSFAGPGVKLEGTVPGSPAEAAGVKSGDRILALDGKPVFQRAAVVERVRAALDASTYRSGGFGWTRDELHER